MGYELANWQDHHKGQQKSRKEKRYHKAHYKLIPDRESEYN